MGPLVTVMSAASLLLLAAMTTAATLQAPPAPHLALFTTKVPAVEGDPVAVWGHDTLTRRLAPSRPPPPTSHHLNTGTARMESFTPPTGPSARSKRSARHRRLLVTTTQRRRSAGRGRTGWVGGGRASRTLSSLHILPRAQPRSKTKYAPKLGIRHLAKPKTMYLRRSGVLSVESDPVAPAVLPTVALGAHHSTNASGTSGAPHSQVVLQEDPYLSPSFFRTDDDGQGFKHYRDFYQESGQEGDVENEAFEEGRNHAKPNVRSFAIPETIVKDGQVFYRYDGGIDGNESIKGQSKRSHARDGEYLSDDGNQNVAQHDLQSSDDHLPTSGTSDVSGVGYPLSHNGFDFYVGPSRVQTQAHIGERSHGATAEAVVDSGPATQVVGSAGVGGFFSAQAQSGGHPGGTSHSQVMGNMHGVQGSAVAHNNGHQSQAHVNMGAHSSSRAQVSTHEGASILVSSVDATQLGGSAGAQAHSSSAAKSQAQMDFNPIQHYDETGGLRGQGLASATMTSEGGSALATLTGQVTRGSYLGVAHSSSGTHHLADTHPSQPHFIPEHSTRNHLSVDDNMLTGDESQEEFAHIDFLKPESGQEEYSEEQHLHTDFVPVEVIRDSLPQEQEDQDDKWEGIVIDDLADPGLLQDRGREDSPRLDESGTLGLGRNIASAHDMLSSIVETVHQPHMVDSYPNTGHIIDAGGLVGGSGQPPKESEVGQAPIHTRPYIDEGVGILTGNIKKGVGLATYSQGSLGPAPSPGEIVNISPSLSPYDYDHTSSEYYDNDYNIVPSQQPPYFDLGPEIFNLQPIELSYEHLQPTDSAVLTPEAPVQLNGGQDKAVPPDPPIVIHQVQTSSPHLPGGSPSPSPHTPPLPLVEAIMPALHQQPNSDEGRGSSSQPEYRPWVGQAGTDEARPWVGQAGTDEARPWVGQAGTDEARPWVGQAGTDEARPWVGQAGTDEARPWVGQAGTDEARPWVGQAGTDEARPWVGQAGTDEARPWVGQAGTDEARPWVGQAGTDEARPWVGQAGTDEARPWVGQAGTDEAEPEHRPWVGQVGTADAESEHRPWVGQVGTADAEPEHRPWVGQVGTADAEPEHRPWVGQVGTADAEPEHRPWVGQAGTAEAQQVRGTEDMVTVPLVATSPGTSITLPGTTGGPVINVMTMSASQNMINSSLLAQRPGSPIQPGEKIPGAPGYRVPSGFRGHVILGHKLPVEADSRRVVEGFNTHVRLTPQDTLPNVVFASVGGPHTSQHLPEDNVPGVHVTLSGSEHSQSPVSSAPSSRTPETTSTSGRQVTGVSGRQRPYSQQRVEAAATGQVSESAPWLIMESLRPRNPELTHSSMLVQPVLPGKSWDGVGSMKTSGNSWGRTWSSSNRQPWGSGGSSGQKQPAMCKYYTISCQVVYSPYQQSKRCKPTYTTRECCC
nr:uncharacterized protein LOC123767647 isoform X3 [Procambarus clarkii]